MAEEHKHRPDDEEPAVPAHTRRRHYEDDDDVYEEVHRRTRMHHSEELAESTRKLGIGIVAAIGTVLSTWGTTQYQARERTEEFSVSLEKLSLENAEILKQLSTLLNANLARTTELSENNLELNSKIVRDNEVRRQLHLKELEKLDIIQKHLEGKQ